MAIHARAAFQYEIDDLVDVALRNANRLRGTRSQVLVLGLLLGVAVGAVVKLLDPDDTPSAIAMGALAAVVFAMIYPSQRASTRHNLLELYGSGPFTCTVELHDDHVLWRDDGQHRQSQLRTPWSDLREVRVEGGDWIFDSKTGIAVLRGRAFASSAEADAFWATFERLAAAPSRTTS